MAVAASLPPAAPHTLSHQQHRQLAPEQMSTPELESLAAELAGKGKGKGKDALLVLAGAKAPSVRDLLQQPVDFVEPKVSVKEDEIPYKAVNVKTPAPTANGTSSSSLPSNSGSPVASTSKLPPASSSSSSTPAAGSSKRVFPLVDQSVSWPKPYSVGAGLQNIGNTCFLNSALQCLLHTPPLVRWLESGAHPTPCEMHKKKGFCATCSMKLLVKHSFVEKKRSYAPSILVKNLKQIGKHFRFGRQEDSHEFLRFLIDAMQASALFTKGGSKAPPAVQHQTPLHQLFGGRLRSRVHCQSCGHNSDTFDSILDLSLDLGNRADSLKAALENLVKVDRLTGGNKYKCEKCKKLVNAEKSFTIEDAPLVLTIHLKRFTPLGRKISGLVKYPEKLALGGYMSDPSLNPSYRLYALILHSGGGPHSGHYTAYVRSSQGKWHDMNDESVSSCPPPMMERNAYVLFYMREKGDALRQAVASGAGGGAEAAKQGGGGSGKKRARDSLASNASGAGTPVKRARQDDQEQEQSSPPVQGIRIPFATASSSRPPEIMTASKVASPRMSNGALASPPKAPAVNPFLPPTTSSSSSVNSPSSAAPKSGGLMAPIKAKEFIHRAAASASAGAQKKSLVANLQPRGGGGKLSKSEKRRMKMEKRGRMGLVVPSEGSGGGGGGGGGGKGKGGKFGGGGKKNAPRMLS
ncbi:hypothetical protein JCM10213_005519 [Rhodosporidiobolus nylandii]